MLTTPTRTRLLAVVGAVLTVAVVLGATGAVGAEEPVPVPVQVPITAAAAPTAPVAPPPAAPSPTAILHVDPAGPDSGDGSAAAPLRTIQAALDRAEPGTQITLAAGVYRERLRTVRDGSPAAPISIKGPESGTDRAARYRATLYGSGRILSIDHSYYTVEGFTIDGQEQLAGVPLPTDLAAIDAFKDSVQPRVDDSRLIYIGAGEQTHDLTGITIHDMFLSGAGGECVRMRNNAHHNTVTDSVVQYCGMYAKDGDDDERAAYHNGEGIYIGTSPNSEDQPMHENDGSSNNVVARNLIRTFGSECFNVKENAHDNVFADNTCSANAEQARFNGSNIEIRGHRNVVRNNTISDSAGYSVKIATDDEDEDQGGNAVQNNQLSGSLVALKLASDAGQGPICGNISTAPTLVEGELPADITAPC